MRSLLLAAAALLAPAPGDGDAGRPFAPVFEGVVAGDLLLIGNSNLLSAGGWSMTTDADVDGDDTEISAERPVGDALCADNSSSADLDLPAGARVITARLYVETSLGRQVGPVTAELDGPRRSPRRFGERPSTPVSPRKLYEAMSGVQRSAVWDVTDYVTAAAAAPTPSLTSSASAQGPYLPYASWAMVVAYELDPAGGLDGVAPADRHRFDARVVSWHDGFQLLDDASLDVVVPNVEPGPTTVPFGKSLHVIAGGQSGQGDNLLLAGEPLGNSSSPGDPAPPGGISVGRDPACNAVTDVQNDTICVLGTNVAAKTPGAGAFVSSGDGRTRSSGSGVDIDVIRIADRYLRAAGSRPVLRVQATGVDVLAPAVLAVSIDVPRAASP